MGDKYFQAERLSFQFILKCAMSHTHIVLAWHCGQSIDDLLVFCILDK